MCHQRRYSFRLFDPVWDVVYFRQRSLENSFGAPDAAYIEFVRGYVFHARVAALADQAWSQ